MGKKLNDNSICTVWLCVVCSLINIVDEIRLKSSRNNMKKKKRRSRWNKTRTHANKLTISKALKSKSTTLFSLSLSLTLSVCFMCSQSLSRMLHQWMTKKTFYFAPKWLLISATKRNAHSFSIHQNWNFFKIRKSHIQLEFCFFSAVFILFLVWSSSSATFCSFSSFFVFIIDGGIVIGGNAAKLKPWLEVYRIRVANSILIFKILFLSIYIRATICQYTPIQTSQCIANIHPYKQFKSIATIVQTLYTNT